MSRLLVFTLFIGTAVFSVSASPDSIGAPGAGSSAPETSAPEEPKFGSVCDTLKTKKSVELTHYGYNSIHSPFGGLLSSSVGSTRSGASLDRDNGLLTVNGARFDLKNLKANGHDCSKNVEYCLRSVLDASESARAITHSVFTPTQENWDNATCLETVMNAFREKILAKFAPRTAPLKDPVTGKTFAEMTPMEWDELGLRGYFGSGEKIKVKMGNDEYRRREITSAEQNQKADDAIIGELLN